MKGTRRLHMSKMLAVFKLKALICMLTSCNLYLRNATPAQWTNTAEVG